MDVYFNLLCVYRLHDFSENEYIQELENVLPNIKNNTIYIGDININTLAQSSNSQLYSSVLSNNGYVSLVNAVTRPVSKSCIDHIFIKNRNLSAFKSAIFDVDLTDHCMLGLRFQPNIKSEKVE